MNGNTYAPQSSIGTTIVAAVAAAIAIGLISLVVAMFRADGSPFEQLVAAEKACTQYKYVSEREHCVNEWLAAARATRVANK
jgi:hypothetical protein